MINTVFKDGIFRDRVALITGGGTGIGLRTARELAALGATVVVASRRLEVLEEAVEIIASEGGTAHAVACNIRDEDSIRDCVAQAVERAGPIDFLVNNAGGQFSSPAEKIKRKGWHAVIDTNLTGTFLISKELFRRVFRERGGAVVNVIADVWHGFPGMAHTGAARAGVDNLTKSLATEWGRFGVRVNAVAPGVIETTGLDHYPEPVKAMIHSAKSFNQTYRLGTAAEVAAAILFLLSPAAAFITGETLRVDGGSSIYSPFLPPREHGNLPPFDD